MLADVEGGDIRVELADGREGDVAHDGVAELGGEDREAGCGGWVVVTGDDLGKDFASETCDVGRLASSVGAGDRLTADDVQAADGDAALVAQGVIAGVLVEDAGQEPSGEIGIVSLVEETAPGVGIEASDAFAEGWM